MSPQLPPPAWRAPQPLPSPVVETDRLRIRWYAVDDANALHEAVAEGREALSPFLPWVRTSHRTAGESRRFIESAALYRSQVTADDFVMAIVDRKDGTLVGGTGFHRIEPVSRTGELGYWIRPASWGRGFATETARAMLDVGFGAWAFHRIKLCCADHNAASIRVIEKVGARLEGIEREERWLEGSGWVDSRTYAILAHEWNEAEQRGPGGTSI